MSRVTWVRTRQQAFTLLIFLSLLFLTQISSVARADSGAIIRVTIIGAASGFCGSTWVTACDLQYALNTVANSGDEIWVAAGTYYPTSGADRTLSFQLRNGIALYGGFAGNESERLRRDWTANVTKLSGDINKAGDDTDNSYHVVVGSGTDNTAIMDGFTVTDGNASSLTGPNEFGGGMYNYNGSPKLSNVDFEENSAYYSGAGMYNHLSSPVLENDIFENNSTLVKYDGFGGGMYNEDHSNPTLTSVVFRNNSALGIGGGMFSVYYCSPSLTNVTFINNYAPEAGGMYNEESSGVSLYNVTFTGNTASSYGGGMFNRNSSPVLVNVTFNGNQTNATGGGMYNDYSSPTLTNVTFSGNSAGYGGGMADLDTSSPILTNVTFSGNSATMGGGIFTAISTTPVNPLIRNTIFGANTADSGPQVYSVSNTITPDIRDSVVQGGCPTGSICTRIVIGDPFLGLLNTYGGTTPVYPLGPGSSAINMADPASCPGTDQRGYPRRVANGFCDIGAYEAQPAHVNSMGGFEQSTAINTPFPTPLSASVSDDAGNLLAGSVVTFTLPSAGASATWSGSTTITRTTGLAGAVTAPEMTANGIAGVYTASASIGVDSTSFGLTNLKGDSATAITSSKNPSLQGDLVSFTVTVTAPSGTPTGIVDFYETPPAGLVTSAQPQTFDSQALINGSTTFSVPSLTPGAHTFRAVYNGDSNYNASDSVEFAQDVTQVNQTLTVSKTGSGFGTVTGITAGIDCGTKCSATTAIGTVVTLTAVPDANSTFVGWSVNCTPAGDDCVITMTSDTVVTAKFIQYPVYLPVVTTH